MKQIRKLIESLFGRMSDELWKIILAVVYWSIAVVILIAIIFVAIKLTTPTGPVTPTPDLTATLQQAIIEALGPPTATPAPSLTPIPSDTPTPSITPLASLTPTLTPTSLPTATPSATPLLPTLTPALPFNVDDAFQLKDLSAEDYEIIIDRMEGFPELLPEGNQNENYHAAFYHAMVAAYEATLKFPQNPLAESWRWRLAYHLSQIGDGRASILYATLISQGLNNQGWALEDLPAWVQSRDDHLKLSVQYVNPIGENFLNRVLDLQTPGGSIFLWLVEDGSQTIVYALCDETNYQTPHPAEVIWGDLNNDQWEEIIIVIPRSEGRKLDIPRVFDLTQSPPKELLFNPEQKFEIGLENTYKWTANRNEQGYYDLQLVATVYPPCLLDIRHTYHWQDGWLERITETYQVQPISQLLGYCELLVDQASTTWNIPAAIQIMEQLLPMWPPPSTSDKSYPLDAADEWRFRLGVYHALEGDMTTAKTYLEGILQTPMVPRSRWVTAADKFLTGLDNPVKFYHACLETSYCDPRLALQKWVASLTPEQAPYALYHLSGGGVSVRFSDRFDFEGDGFPERWFTLRHHPMDRLEFWILSEGTQGTQALFVTTVENNKPNLIRYTDYNGRPYTWIDAQQSFRLVRDPDPLKTAVELLPPSYYYSALTNQIASNSIDALLSGFSPYTILIELQNHLDSRSFTCLNKEDCARFYYALGLAAELSGNERLAVESYLKIWWDSFESPFSTLVRLKLTYKPGYAPIPTITPTPTRTSTSTITPTATKTPFTVTPTFTQDPNRTYTPTPTASNTSEAYP